MYPPPGYVEIEGSEVGNGDSWGWYVAVGRENAQPVLCTTTHDAFAVLPVACTPAAWPPAADVDVDDPEELLALDPRSPLGLVLAARAAVGSAAVERLIRPALELLPEYADAWLEVAVALRRQRRQAEALEAMLQAFTAPLAFGSHGVRERCFQWLRRAPDAALPGERDPIWLRRRELTLAQAVRWNDDYVHYGEAVEAYHELGWGVRAVRLRMLIGELMSLETVSFQERYGWSAAGHAEKLRADVERAGLERRLPLLAPR